MPARNRTPHPRLTLRSRSACGGSDDVLAMARTVCNFAHLAIDDMLTILCKFQARGLLPVTPYPSLPQSSHFMMTEYINATGSRMYLAPVPRMCRTTGDRIGYTMVMVRRQVRWRPFLHPSHSLNVQRPSSLIPFESNSPSSPHLHLTEPPTTHRPILS